MKTITNIAVSILLFLIPLLAAGQDENGTLAYNPNYLLIGEDSIQSNESVGRGECDIKFQLSFAKRIKAPKGLEGGNVDEFLNTKFPIYFAYTQESFWDICKESAPFRETNYRPELFYHLPSMSPNSSLFIGYEHESNGRDGDQSQGWDRFYIRSRASFGEEVASINFSTSDKNEWIVDWKIWYPFSVSSNNSKITRFAGYGEFSLSFTPSEDLKMRATVRKGGGFKDWDRGYFESDIIFPLPGVELHGMVQFSNGYGPSLERFDQHEWAFRFGVVFSDFGFPSD